MNKQKTHLIGEGLWWPIDIRNNNGVPIHCQFWGIRSLISYLAHPTVQIGTQQLYYAESAQKET